MGHKQWGSMGQQERLQYRYYLLGLGGSPLPGDLNPFLPLFAQIMPQVVGHGTVIN